MQNMDDIKVGDTVIIQGTHDSIAQVIKVTPTQFATKRFRFQKATGRQVGGDTWYAVYARLPENDAEVQEIRQSVEQRKLINTLRRLDWSQLSLDHLQRIAMIIVDTDAWKNAKGEIK